MNRSSYLRSLAGEWLRDFSLALKNVSRHSEGHPRGQEYLDRALETLRRVMNGRSEITVRRTESSLVVEGVELEREDALAGRLAEDLEERGVDGCVIRATITADEHASLVRCLLAKPDEVRGLGGLAAMLAREGVASVTPTSVYTPGPETAASVLESCLIRVLEGRADAPIDELLSHAPAEVAHALTSIVRDRQKEETAGPAATAEMLADALERIAEHAILEHRRDRAEVLADIGRAMVATDPDIHTTLFLEKAGQRSIRKNLVNAVEGLPPSAIGALVVAHCGSGAARRYAPIVEILNRTGAWKQHRPGALEAIGQGLRANGLEDEKLRDVIDQLVWSEIPTERRLDLLGKGEALWRIDFVRVREVLAKLFASGEAEEATGLTQRYLEGLRAEDLVLRRRVADNIRHLLQLLERTGKGKKLLRAASELFFTRLHEEKDEAIAARLSGGLAFLADVWLRSGQPSATLELMRRAESLGASADPRTKKRGGELIVALSRAGSDKIFETLTRCLLDGTNPSSLEAAEILKRGGSRSASYLISVLAEEENRTHRARLVMLLKEMGSGSSRPFMKHLDDPRWYLVRNVVGILGDIGDSSVMPQLKGIARHHDPRVRREAVRTFMRFATPECEELIVGALSDEDRGVQMTAVGALATLKTTRCLGALIDIARRSGTFGDLAAEIRCEAVRSLGRINAKEALPVLEEILTRRGFLGHAEPTDLRVAAARALGSLSSSKAKKLLELARKDPRQAVREAARRAQEGERLDIEESA